MNYSTVYVSVMQDRASVVFDLDGLASRLANLPDHRLRQPVMADRIGRVGANLARARRYYGAHLEQALRLVLTRPIWAW
jgi:hypothetical protein